MNQSRAKLYDTKNALHRFQTHPLFGRTREWEINSNQFRRPLFFRPVELELFAKPLGRDDYFTDASLSAHRLLATINHGDYVYLPNDRRPETWKDFASFYESDTRIAGQILRPVLEAFLFGFLDEQAPAAGNWNESKLKDYFLELPEAQKGTESKLVRAILNSRNPQRAAKNVLIQFSADFLTEGSTLGRKVLGNFGEAQSNLIHIFMEENGSGNHASKHSTLYEKLLRAYDLSDQPYRYWQNYLISSFAVPNFLTHLAHDHRNFFRHIGTVYYAETTYYHISFQLSAMLKQIFGQATETRYFDEHYEMDQSHSQIAFDELVCPLLERFGASVAAQIVQGYEEFRAMDDLCADDLIEQLALMDGIDNFRVVDPAKMGESQSSLFANSLRFQSSTSLNGIEQLPSRINDVDVVYFARNRTIDVMVGHDCVAPIRPNEGLMIPRGRVHALGSSETAAGFDTYEIDRKAATNSQAAE
jgi:hypothetical protein